MAAPAYALTNYLGTTEPASDLQTLVETQLTAAGWTYVEQVTFTQSATARQMRVWKNPSTLNAAGADFYIGIVRNTAAGQVYISIRTFEGWNSTNKTIINPTMASSVSGTTYPFVTSNANVRFVNGQFMVPVWQYNGAANALLYVSTDGATWSVRRLPSTAQWGDIVYGNSTYVLMPTINPALFTGTNATSAYLTSTDGVTWTPRTMPVSASWAGIAWLGGTANVFVAYQSASATYYTSPDAITWTPRTTGPTAATLYPLQVANNSLVIGASSTATTLVYQTTNPVGTTWNTTSWTMPSSQLWSHFAYANGTYVATASLSLTSAAAVSVNGTTWTAMTMPASGNWRVYSSGTQFLAVSSASGGSTLAYVSTDGSTWTIATLPMTVTWQNAAYGAGTWAVSAYALSTGTSNASFPLATSTDPANAGWTQRALSPYMGPTGIEQAATNPVTGFPPYAECFINLTASTNYDIAVLASKSYLVVAVNTLGSTNNIYTCFTGLYAPNYTDSQVSNPPLVMLGSSTGSGSVVRPMRVQIEGVNTGHIAAQMAPESVMWGQFGGNKEPVSNSIRGSRVLFVSGVNQGSQNWASLGYNSSGVVGGGIRGWVYDAIAVGTLGLKLGDTVTIGATTYTAVTVFAFVSLTLTAGTSSGVAVLFNTAAGS